MKRLRRAGSRSLHGSCLSREGGAIPAFARKYKVSCQLCHHPFPTLTPFGESFAANGYRMAATEDVRDTVATGDDLLALLKDFPLAIRLDMYAQTCANGRAATDFQIPYGLKLLSGGTLSRKISYYFYTFLVERGDLGGGWRTPSCISTTSAARRST